MRGKRTCGNCSYTFKSKDRGWLYCDKLGMAKHKPDWNACKHWKGIKYNRRAEFDKFYKELDRFEERSKAHNFICK